MKSSKLDKRHRFPPEIIQYAVRLFFEIATQIVYERFWPAAFGLALALRLSKV